MYVPQALAKEWPTNSMLGFDTHMPFAETGSLHLLLEKDFMCKDAIAEDQSDNYENPNKTC